MTKMLKNFEDIFARRTMKTPRSFLREILKTALQPGMISFAGGLPNRDLFPAEELRKACNDVFHDRGSDILQYSSSEGLKELREAIAARYKRRGVEGVLPDNILVMSGSQQALDLLGKVLINEGDRVVMEEPAYLGAIQALSFYEPKFVPVPLNNEGLDIVALKKAFAESVKLMYMVPTFQNPTGISYTDDNRRAIADIVRGTNTYIIEDDPYGEIAFSNQKRTSFMNLVPENTVMMGTISKTIAPGLRLGWAVMPTKLYDKVLAAKQAADLHTNIFTQHVVQRYLADNDNLAHIEKIAARYGAQKRAMKQALTEMFPASVTHTDPDGGMFLWVTLPKGISALKLLEAGIRNNVCIVPGHCFYVSERDVSTFRMSYSCVDEATIREGVARLAGAYKEVMGPKNDQFDPLL